MTATTFLLPVINLEPYLNDPSSDEALQECQKAADALVKFSALAVRDPNVSEKDNSDYLDLVEDYFNQPFEDKMLDTRPEIGYQVGATPELTEVPRCARSQDCLEMVDKMDEENLPKQFDGADPKWRFFHRIGKPPKSTKFPALNVSPVVPKAFPNWLETMDSWGGKLHNAVQTLSEMVAIGLGFPKDTFTNLTRSGPHLLAPTGSDLNVYGQVGTVLAGFHYDLNFLTIHGKSRFPGLNIWTRDNKKLSAKIPDGCLLVQAAKQMEWLTGGYITAGYHEVVVNEETLKAMEKQKQLNRPLWRISSTLFLHVASDNVLKPLGRFSKEEGIKNIYPDTFAGDQVRKELGLLELMKEG